MGKWLNKLFKCDSLEVVVICARGSSNGRTAGSGPAYRGSNPCPRAHLTTFFRGSPARNAKRSIASRFESLPRSKNFAESDPLCVKRSPKF